MGSRALVFSTLVAVTLISSAAFAKQGHKWACTDAVKQFCSDVPVGGDHVLQCLKQHQSDLSPACVAASEKAEAHHQAFETACGNDVSTLCKDQDTGHGMVWKCLKSQQSQLSAPCRSFTAKAHHEMGVQE